jgi:hypothetical protein
LSGDGAFLLPVEVQAANETRHKKKANPAFDNRYFIFYPFDIEKKARF